MQQNLCLSDSCKNYGSACIKWRDEKCSSEIWPTGTAEKEVNLIGSTVGLARWSEVWTDERGTKRVRPSATEY